MLRVRGKGVSRKGRTPGDLYVRFMVPYRPPTRPTPRGSISSSTSSRVSKTLRSETRWTVFSSSLHGAHVSSSGVGLSRSRMGMWWRWVERECARLERRRPAWVRRRLRTTAPPRPRATFDCGDFSTCAVSTDDAVRCWGRDKRGELGDGARSAERARRAIRSRPRQGAEGRASRRSSAARSSPTRR
jgi:hypothetical protein